MVIRQKHSANNQKLITNSLVLAFSSGGSAVLSFLLSVLIGRVTGQNGLGIYASALAWVFPLSLITEFGLGTLITREVAKSPEQAHAYLIAATKARLLMGGGLMVILWLIAPLLSDNLLLVEGIRISAPMVVILPFFSSFTAIFRAHQRMRPVALLNIGMLISQVTLTAFVFATSSGILLALIVNTLTSAGQLVAAWVIYRARFFDNAETENGLYVQPLLKQAYPFAIAAVLAAVQLRLNILLIERFSGTGEAGFYAAASRFIEAGRLIPMAFFDALFPLLAGLATNPERLNRLFRRVTLGLAGYGLIFGGIVWFAAALLMPGMYGAAFVPAVTVLQIMGLSLLPLLLKQGRTLYWYALGHEQFVNRVTLLAIIVQFALGLWLIPQHGASGAAIAGVITEIAAASFLWIFSKQKHNEPVKSSLW